MGLFWGTEKPQENEELPVQNIWEDEDQEILSSPVWGVTKPIEVTKCWVQKMAKKKRTGKSNLEQVE